MIRLTLKRSKKIRKQCGEVNEVRFKYKKPGNFYYYCGLLGQKEGLCKKLFALPADDDTCLRSSEIKADYKSSISRGYYGNCCDFWGQKKKDNQCD